MSINEFSSAANDETNAVLADALNEALGLDEDEIEDDNYCDCEDCRAKREAEASVSTDMKEYALANLPKTQLAAACLAAYRAGHLDYTETVRTAQFEATDITLYQHPVFKEDNTPEDWVLGMCNFLYAFMDSDMRVCDGKVYHQAGSTVTVWWLSTTTKSLTSVPL